MIGTEILTDVAPVIAYAYTQLGKPYVWGSGPDDFDCSGLTLHAYQTIAVSSELVGDEAVSERRVVVMDVHRSINQFRVGPVRVRHRVGLPLVARAPGAEVLEVNSS